MLSQRSFWGLRQEQMYLRRQLPSVEGKISLTTTHDIRVDEQWREWPPAHSIYRPHPWLTVRPL